MPAAHAPLRIPMVPREPDEPGRTSTQLELLFDLTFVVAVASITAELAHRLEAGHGYGAIGPFLQVFFAIWWAWMNFTWFASSYDCDDVLYRLLTLLQMAGVLVLAAGVPSAFDDDNYRAVTAGYLVMRVGLVALWLRAAASDPAGRPTARRYVVGITLVQAGWLGRLALAEGGALEGHWAVAGFALLAALELSVPAWAERVRHTSWHPHHIAERYGLFTIILLGEGVLAASAGVAAALGAGGLSASLVVVALAGLVLVFAMWWLYFLHPAGEGLEAHRERSYLWGYGHYGIFAALAATGAGLEVVVAQAGHHTELSPVAAAYAVALPVGVFVSLTWAVHAPIVGTPAVSRAASACATAAVMLIPLLAGAVGVPAVVAAIAGVVAAVVASGLRGSGSAWPGASTAAAEEGRLAQPGRLTLPRL